MEASERRRLSASRGRYCFCHMPLLSLITWRGCQRDRISCASIRAEIVLLVAVSPEVIYYETEVGMCLSHHLAAAVVCLECTGLWNGR